MKTRIREIRRQRGMTLQQLAESIRPEPTTPQTIGRLETGIRTVSLDWLTRIAQALDCHVSDLLELPERPEIPLLGQAGAQGVVSPSAAGMVDVAPAALNPVAVRISAPAGPYAAGDLLVCDRYEGADMDNALGHDAVAATTEGHTLLCRVIRGTADGTYTLVSLEPGGRVFHDARLAWAAAVKTLFRTIR
jgi:transcriptional regulator with XRE-family HTH domain